MTAPPLSHQDSRSRTPIRAERGAFPGIELLRFLCAFAVLCWHYQHFFWGYRFDSASQPFHSLLKLFYDKDGGEFAVQVFWTISGFIFFWKYAGPLHGGEIDGKTFFVRRFSRLYPLHLATLLVVAVLQAIYTPLHAGHPFVFAGNNLTQFVFQVLFISHWALQESTSFNGPVWSVMMELLAYALFFLIATNVRLSRLRGSMFVALFFSLVWYAGAIFLYRYATCFLLFFVGGLVYNISIKLSSAHDHTGLATLRRMMRLVCFCVVALTVSDIYVNHSIANVTIGKSEELLVEYLHFVFTPALLLLFAGLPFPGWRLPRIASTLGNLTYASYMIHFPLQLLVIICLDAADVPRGLFARSSAFIAYASVVLLCSYFIYRRFERPAQDFLRRRLLGNPGDVAFRPDRVHPAEPG